LLVGVRLSPQRASQSLAPTVAEYADVSGSGLIAGRLSDINFDLALRQAQVKTLIVRAQTIARWASARCTRLIKVYGQVQVIVSLRSLTRSTRPITSRAPQCAAALHHVLLAPPKAGIRPRYYPTCYRHHSAISPRDILVNIAHSLIDWISDSRSQECTNLQSLITCLAHGDTVACSHAGLCQAAYVYLQLW